MLMNGCEEDVMQQRIKTLLLIVSFLQHDCNTKFRNISYSQAEENQLHNFRKSKRLNLACA